MTEAEIVGFAKLAGCKYIYGENGNYAMTAFDMVRFAKYITDKCAMVLQENANMCTEDMLMQKVLLVNAEAIRRMV